MITGISIENFKGIGERVDLDFGPITLLFGANSAGKSSILHALHYAREIFERHNLDADRTIAGGDYVDLGGFKRIVHNHDLKNTIRIGITVNTEECFQEFDDLPALNQYLQVERWGPDQIDELAFFDSATFFFSVQWSQILDRPFISRFELEVGDEVLADIDSDPQGQWVSLKLNKAHPCLSRLSGWTASTQGVEQDFEDIRDFFPDPSVSIVSACQTILNECCQMTQDGRLLLLHQDDALPYPHPFLFPAYRDLADLDTPEDEQQYSRKDICQDLIRGINRVIFGPLDVLKKSLTQFRYLGPLRETPPRTYQPPRYPDPSRWASGLGAWDALYNGTDKLINHVSDWLSDPGNLKAGCRIERRSHIELDKADPVVRKLIARNALDDIEESLGEFLSK